MRRDASIQFLGRTAAVLTIVVAAVAVGELVGAQLRASREQLLAGQAAAASHAPPATATINATRAPKTTPIATPAVSASIVPTATDPVVSPAASPLAEPSGVAMVLTGTVTAGGAPVRAAQIMVYPSNSLNHGPTPVPPEAAKTTTDDRGFYQVTLPPGTYRIGVFRDYTGQTRSIDGFYPITWYGDAYAIGFGKDVTVAGNVTGANISMLRSVTVGGRVLGRDGVSVPNAQVSLSKMFGGIQYPLSGGVTDRTGGFTLTTVAMPMTLAVQASGRTTPAWTTIDLDVRGDRTDLVATIDRGNIVTGTLRDASGRALADTDFGASPSDAQVSCLSCNARTDAAGHFALTLPSATIRFQTWGQPNQPALVSIEYPVNRDMTLDPVLKAP
ncbi:MAG: hypothetical protein E6H87_10015 [Chloroflexi bacterium]|nr:MAG: hypothetical protein E6H87_10015 [Chloroflexota bacterium]